MRHDQHSSKTEKTKKADYEHLTAAGSAEAPSGVDLLSDSALLMRAIGGSCRLKFPQDKLHNHFLYRATAVESYRQQIQRWSAQPLLV
jgi:hypothetical protein